jgi:hypothetical protein
MQKFIQFTTAILLLFPLVILGQIYEKPKCFVCEGNQVSGSKSTASGLGNIVTGNYSAAFGLNNTITGTHAHAFGENSGATGSHALAIGYDCHANANYAFALGKNAVADEVYAFSLGKYSESHGAASFSMGTYLKANNQYSIIIGKGYGYSFRLENNIENSLMIGFNSTLPTFFVNPAPGNGKTGRIGIGNITAPTAKLHIKADINEDAAIMLEPTGSAYTARILFGDNDHSISAKTGENLVFKTGSGNHFVFANGRVGIGISTPSQTLDVEGTMRVSSLASPTQKMIVTTPDGTLTTMNIPAGDNLGNHIMTQNLTTAGHWINSDSDPNQGIYIDGGGRVGIGTGTPITTLEVAGTIKATTFSGDGSLLTNITGDNLGNHIATQNINLNGKYLSGDGDAEGIYISNQGKIGIGTYAPAAQIEVYGGVNNVVGRFKSVYSSLNIGHAISDDGLGVWGSTYIGFNLRRDADNQWKTEWDGASNGAAMIYGTSGGDLIFTCVSHNAGIQGIQQLNNLQIKDNAKMILRSDGLLKVNEVVVKTNIWSDYVFKDDYPLAELAEVEEFINKNRHLPDVPSEAEVLEVGINLGEMDAILLRKIEELTLHIIKQQKEIDALKQAFKESNEPVQDEAALQQLPEEPKK